MEWIVSLFLLLGRLISVYSDLLPRTNSSNLCSRIPIQSCLHQFNNPRDIDWNSQTCNVEVANNTHVLRCNNQNWDYDKTCQSHDGCGVQLEVYRHMPSDSLPLYRTAFNLTLSNIPSGKINLRFRETLIGNFSFCINVTTSLTIAQPFESLWYDCVFHSRLYEGHPFQLEFISDNRYGLYLFDIPTEKDIRNGRGFLYVHMHHSPNIVVTFQKTSELHLSTSYLIVVCQWLQDSCHVTLHHLVDLKNASTFSNRFKNSVTVSLGKLSSSGNFSIRIEDPACNSETEYCYQAKSTFFMIEDIQESYILFLPALGILAFVTFCATMGYRNRIKRIVSGLGSHATQRKTILLVHDSATSDCCWIEAVRMFLQNWGGFDVLVDFIEIPQSQHKDPLIWYSEAMETVDAVAVVSPPADALSLLDQRPAIYHHTFDLALELVAMRISRRLKLKQRKVLQHFVVLETSGSSVPDACSSFARFRVPAELPNLISYVVRDSDENNSLKAFLADCLPERCTRSKESAAIDSFHMFYQHVQQSSKSPDGQVRDSSIVDDANHVAEHSALLETTNEDRDRRREQLDREFGSGIASLTTLTTLG